MNKLLIVLLGSAFFSACSPSYFMRTEALPKDLKKEGHVLLVLNQEDGAFQARQNRYVEKQMRKNCKCAFEMVSQKDLIENPKYKDLDKYPYLVMKNMENALVYISSPASMSGSTSYREYSDQVFIDRRTNQKLPSTGMNSGSYAKGMSYLSKKIAKQKL